MRNNPNSVTRAVASLARMFSAASPVDLSNITKAADDASDQWNGAETSARNLGIGPTERMSGGGAFEMSAEYSSPGPQTGNTNAATRLGQLFDEIRSLAMVPGSRTVTPPTSEGSFLGGAKAAMRQAKGQIIKAVVAADATAKATAVSEAARHLESARQLLKAAADDTDEDEAEDDEEMEKAAKSFGALADRIDALTSGRVMPPDMSRKGSLASLTVPQVMAAVAGRGLANPPDLSGFAKSQAAAPLSISERIEQMENAGTLNEGQVMKARSLLQHFQAVQSGRVPQGEFVQRLAGVADDQIGALFGGVERVPASLRLAG